MYTIESATNQEMRDLAKSPGFSRKVDHDYSSEVVYGLDL